MHPSVIQQLCFVAIIEHIEKGIVRKWHVIPLYLTVKQFDLNFDITERSNKRCITVYKQGEEALNWFALLYGSLDVQISHTGKRKVG